MHHLSLFIFRRDLRLEDNTGLREALQCSEKVLPCFIFTPEQIENNPYKGEHSLHFMLEALQDLDGALKKQGGRLYFFSGTPQSVVENCLKSLPIQAVFAGRDYTPYSIQRDQKILATCAKRQVLFSVFDDVLLHPPEDTVKENGTPYLVFTPFYKKMREFPVQKPATTPKGNYFSDPVAFEHNPGFGSTVKRKTKREECLAILKRDFSDYPEASTHLSPYLKFTVCSPREIYWALYQQGGKDSPILRQLYWRDFFYAIAFFFPHVFERAFHKEFNALQWSGDQDKFRRWCSGQTGFPFIDAAMRQLNQTGWMPNRQRMATASFLVKDLHIHWQWGERYFAQHLTDYDPALNNGNWQWVAGTGVDAQPYFRIFNPWTQQRKFDAECTYIKEWVPELRELPPKAIHDWEHTQHHLLAPGYPSPMLEHREEAKATLAAYTKLKS